MSEPPWSPEGSRRSVKAYADQIEQRLVDGVPAADLEMQMDVLEAGYGMFVAAHRGEEREYTKVVRDAAEAMEAAARREEKEGSI